MPPRVIAKNLALPTGLVGGLIALEMNRRNAKMNAFALEALELAPSERVLEVGFGGGVNLPALLARAGSVTGVDPSPLVLRRARTRHRAEVAAGKADFRSGRAEALPFGDGAFDKVLTVNTVYFWKDLAAGFREIRRVLATRGRVAVGFLPAEAMAKLGMPEDIFTLRRGEDLTEAMTAAGLAEVSLRRPAPETPWAVVTGSAPG